MVRAGRISDDERFEILVELGEEAIRRYQYNLRNCGYKGYGKFKNAMQYEPDVAAFDNYYYLDTGNEELNRILRYLEYGTGLYGPKGEVIQSSKTSPRTGNQLLLKFKYKGHQLYKMTVKGIKPAFNFTKAVESVRNERNMLQRQIRRRLGI